MADGPALAGYRFKHWQGSDGKTWYAVTFDNVSGYIRSDLVEAHVSEATAEPAVDETQETEEPEEEPIVDNSADYSVAFEDDGSGSSAWYLHDNTMGTRYQVSDLLNAEETNKNNQATIDQTAKSMRFVVILMAFVIVVLIIVVTILIIKVRSTYEDYDDYDDDDEDEHEHHHHHHDDDDEDEHEHHHHDDDDECDDPDCCCHHHHDEDGEHHHHHHHHHGHDADEVFVSWGEETHKKFTKAEIEGCLKALEDAEKYGMVLRCKGYVANAEGGKWIHFDYVPGEPDIREGGAMVTGRICVIGSKLNEQAVAELFGTAH